MMESNVKSIATACMASAILTVCNDWSDIENIKVNQPDVKEINSELCAQYLQKLRIYKDPEHKFVYASSDNSIKTPFSRGHHLNGILDGIDVVSLIYPDGFVEFEQKEIENIYMNRATRIVCAISYDTVEEEYSQMVKTNQETDRDHVISDSTPYLESTAKEALRSASVYNYDGLIIGYIGKSPLHMMEEEKNELLSIQNTFLNPIKTRMEQHKDKTFTSKGKPQNLVDKTTLESFKHIILNTLNITAATELSYNAEMAIMREGVSGSFIVPVSIIDPNNKITGLYDNEAKRVLTKATYWVSGDAINYERTGLSTHNVERDCYNVNNAY